MKSISKKGHFILLSIILCIVTGFIPLFGADKNRDQTGIQFFTRDIILELTRGRNTGASTREDIAELSDALSHFFIDFKYTELSETAYYLAQDKDPYRISGDIRKAFEWLDQNKESLFGSIQINSQRFHEFINDQTNCYTTISLDTSKLDLKPGEIDFMLMVLAAAMTSKGPFYLDKDEYVLQGISLNWLMAGQFMSGMIGGAPGGYPVKPASTVVEADYAMDNSVVAASSSKVIKEYTINLDIPLRENVDVFILDTVPVITEIYEGYVAYSSTNKVTDDILSSIGTKHTLHYNPGTDPDFHTYANEYYNNEDLSDHGTFIAGIIHLLAGNADLHLLEVLNTYGIGTMDSLLWGFREILDLNDPGEPFVVNASLATKLRFPDKEEPYNEEITDIRIKMVYGMRTPSLLLSSLKNVIALINRENGIVIAAAGNDSDSKHHCDSGYPARFDRVIAVGSVQRNGIISSFSNNPGPGGVLAFGGEVDTMNMTKDGLLSMYLSNTYGDTATVNTSGWAVWAGSSFATGIVSGVITTLLEKGYATADAQFILESSCYTSGGYDVLPVDQGP